MKKLLLTLMGVICSLGISWADNKFTATWDDVTTADLTAEPAPTVSGTAGGDQASSISVSNMSWGTLSSKGGPSNIWYSSTDSYLLYAIEAPNGISDNVYLQFTVSSASATKLVSITGLTMRWAGSSGGVVAAVKYSLDGGVTFSELSGSGTTILDSDNTKSTAITTTNVLPLNTKNQINTTTFTAATATTAKSSVIIRIYPYSTGSYKFWCKSVVLNGTAAEPAAPATLDHITVDGKDYAASTAVTNTFTISDQIFTKNPTVSYTNSKSQQTSVTMTAQNDGTSTGSFAVNGTNYSVVCQNYTKVTTSKIQQLNGSTSNAGTFADPNENGNNKNTEWSNTTANPGYTISADQTPGRFSAGWWGTTRTYGFCVSGATLRIHCPANVKIEGVAIYGATWYDNVKITADAEKYIVPTNNIVANANGDASNGNQIRIIKKTPAYGEDFVITIGSQINCYFVLFGETKANESATITSAGYATFSSACPLNLENMTEGYTAYVATAATGDAITLSPIASVVPANTGLIIKGDAGTCTIPTSTEAGTAPAKNYLVAVTADGTQVSGANKYVLGVDGGTVKFLQCNSTAATLNKGKAYLDVTGAGKSLRITFGDATGIDLTPALSQGEGAGKYLENGKIVIVKNGKKFNVAGAQMK